MLSQRFILYFTIVCVVLILSCAQLFGRQFSFVREGRRDSTVTSQRSRVDRASADSLLWTLHKPRPLKWHSMITNLPGDWARFYEEKFQLGSIPKLAGISALTAGLMLTDKQSYEVSDRWYKRSHVTSEVSNLFVAMGDGTSQFGLAGAFAAYGLVKGDDRALRTGSEIAEAVLASGAVVQVLKHLTGRESPFVRSSPTGVWKFFPNQIAYHKHVPAYDAFPSGHICTSLATVVVIAENYPDTKWIQPVGYVLTGLVGVSMVNRGIHWYSDYPLGLALGYAFGAIAAHHDGLPFDGSGERGRSSLTFSPMAYRGKVGLSMAFRF